MISLHQEGLSVDLTSTFPDAKDKICNTIYDLAIIDTKLNDAEEFNVQGMELLIFLKHKRPSTKAIVLTGYPNIRHRTRALSDFGAQAYLSKDITSGDFEINKFTTLVHQLIQNSWGILVMEQYDVLVIEDNDSWADLYTTYLNSFGYSCRIKKDFSSAKNEVDNNYPKLVCICLDFIYSNGGITNLEKIFVKNSIPFILLQNDIPLMKNRDTKSIAKIKMKFGNLIKNIIS